MKATTEAASSAMATLDAAAPAAPFVHEALYYADDADYLEGTVPFIEAGLAAGEPVLVAVPSERLELLRAHVRVDDDLLRMEPMERMGRNPAWIIPAWAEFVASRRPGQPARGIGEPIWATRTAAELVECERHESLLNPAFRDAAAFQLLCPYDTSSLAPSVIETSRRNHPHLACHGEHHASASYDGEIDPYLTTPLPEPPADVVVHRFDFGLCSHRRVRGELVALARAACLGPRRVDDLEIVVGEALNNSIRHAGGAGRVRVWSAPNSMVIEFVDRGTIDEPLAGRVAPRTDAEDGRGLWLMHQLSDLIQVRRFADHQVVRVQFHAP